MPPGEVVWCVLLLTAIFYVASSFLLRLCCILANWVGIAAGPSSRMRIPGYGTTLGIIFVAGFLMGMLEAMANSPTSLFGKGYFDADFLLGALVVLR